METHKFLDLPKLKLLAQSLAKKYGKKDAVIGLIGPLGAGKTTFVKSFASEFGIRKIKSPTFIIATVYDAAQRKLYHMDFYRLETAKQLSDIGLDEILKAENRIVIIEWVDKFPNIKKRCDIVMTFQISGKNTRNVTIR